MKRPKLGTRRWSTFRKRILMRDLYRCRYAYPGCTRTATQVDHLIDRVLEGPVFDERNCFSVCVPCHKEKGRRRQRGEALGVFSEPSSAEMRQVSRLHTPKNDGTESGPLLSGDYQRQPVEAGGRTR